DTLIDSHALVGSCAQVGKKCHLSAGAQIGGVLEPVGALPVIIEDEVLVGGNTGVYEGAIVGRGAVLAAGTILTGSTPVFDLVRGGGRSGNGTAMDFDGGGCGSGVCGACDDGARPGGGRIRSGGRPLRGGNGQSGDQARQRPQPPK